MFEYCVPISNIFTLIHTEVSIFSIFWLKKCGGGYYGLCASLFIVIIFILSKNKELCYRSIMYMKYCAFNFI